MKRVVWKNKSNEQLCATIPKNSGIKDGDIINIEKEKIKKIVYSFVVADLFHYGHLRFLEKANELGDFHVCGVLTDDAASSYRKKPVAGFKERRAIVSNLRCVDMVVAQRTLDTTENLKELHKRFKSAKLVLVHGSNWDKIPGKAFVKKIGGKIIKLPYYEKLSDKKVEKEIKKR